MPDDMSEVDRTSAPTILPMEHDTLQMIRTATITGATGRSGLGTNRIRHVHADLEPSAGCTTTRWACPAW
ncbi:hypothetical protein [Lentzea sp.]|uniref:hypothetical protein n=1 Tax=Lentzea sp. TaxID=56099 RepID=UPI002C5F1499|nr:hypothetical protein [Lentzea sp.]HUQ62027.1 hypothetical protein [Lentzea sp.]